MCVVRLKKDDDQMPEITPRFKEPLIKSTKFRGCEGRAGKE